MTMQSNKIAIVQLNTAVNELGELSRDMLFVGGSIVPLLFTSNSNYFRATRDIDCVINVTALVDYYQFVEKLKQIGFKEMVEDDSPICRWSKSDLVIDIIPTTNVLGFTNSWYLPAFNNPVIHNVDNIDR